jgi:hypothetical protein
MVPIVMNLKCCGEHQKPLQTNSARSAAAQQKFEEKGVVLPPSPNSEGIVIFWTRQERAPTNLLLKVLAPVVAMSVCAAMGLVLWLRQKRKRSKQEGAGGSKSYEQQHGEADFEREVAGPRRF